MNASDPPGGGPTTTPDSSNRPAGRRWRGRVFIGVSLDGFIARRDGDIGWLTDPPDGVGHAAVASDAPALEWDTFYPTVDHLVMGRGTYEKVLTFGFWPYEGVHTLVVSTTLETDDPRVTVVRGIAAAAAALADAGARVVYVDGGAVIRGFLRADLIDEVTLSVAPVLLGDGLPLFGDVGRDVRLRLTGSHVLGSGMVATTYEVCR